MTSRRAAATMMPAVATTLDPRPRRARLQPLREPEREAPSQGAGSPMSWPELRILVVDDDVVFNKLFPRSLERAIAEPRLRLAVATTPEEALERARELDPHVVLCDYDLGVARTGVDVLRDLKTAHPSCLRVLLSGHQKQEIPGFHEAPIDAFLDKPMRLLDLVPRLAILIEEKCGLRLALRE